MALGLTRTFQSTFITLGAYISIKNFGFRTYISTKICGIRAHISIKIYNFRLTVHFYLIGGEVRIRTLERSCNVIFMTHTPQFCHLGGIRRQCHAIFDRLLIFVNYSHCILQILASILTQFFAN